MTELSFLISLLLDEELPLKHKKMIADRIKDVENNLQPKYVNAPGVPYHYAGAVPANGQAPSTQKILDEMALAPVAPPAPPVATTAAAAQALQARNMAIQEGMSGKSPAGRTSPRKF